MLPMIPNNITIYEIENIGYSLVNKIIVTRKVLVSQIKVHVSTIAQRSEK